MSYDHAEVVAAISITSLSNAFVVRNPGQHDSPQQSRRTIAVIAVYAFLSSISFTSQIGPFPELLLKRQCDAQGLYRYQCQEGERGTEQFKLYVIAEKTASHDNLVFSLLIGIANLFAVPFLGALSDAIGRRLPLCISAIANIISALSIAILPPSRQQDILLIIVSLSGLGGGFYAAAGMSFSVAADLSQGATTAVRARMFSIVELFIWLGLLVGPIFFGVMAGFVGVQNSFYIPAALNVVSLSLLFTFKDTLELGRRSKMKVMRATPIGSLFLMCESWQGGCIGLALLFSLCCAAALTFVGPYYIKQQVGFSDADFGAWQSLSYGSSSVGLLLGLPFAMRLLALNHILILSLLSICVTTSLYSVSASGWCMFVLAGSKFLEALMFPVARACVTNIYGTSRYGESMSMVALLQTVSTVVGPVYQVLYSATMTTVIGPVHGITFLVAGGIGSLGLLFGLLIPRIDPCGEVAVRSESVTGECTARSS